MSIFQNTCKPVGRMGKLMVSSMNIGHRSLHEWGFKMLNIKDDALCLDIGCGGGTNLKRMLSVSNITRVYGIDYSFVSVEKSSALCKKDIEDGRCNIQMMDVKNLEFDSNMFDIVTAFETVYFWGNIEKAFSNIYKTMKDGGEFLICNETNGKDKSQEKWCNIIDGMVIYKIDEIKAALEKAGFKEIEINDSDKSWIAFKAKK